MPGFLRQSTAAQSRTIGPFTDDTDFKSAETALTIANTDIKLIVNGAASVNKNSGGGTHRVNGEYGVTFDATDTATVGEMKVSVVVAGALPVFDKFFVVEEAVYDQLFAASALGYIANAPVNVAQISGDTSAADNLETAYDDTPGPVPWVGITDQGTAQSATATTLVLRAGATFADGTPVGSTLWAFGSTQGYWQAGVILGYVGGTDTATVPTWVVTPSGTITYKVFGSAAGVGVAQTGDAYARLGAPAGASIAADIATRLATAGYTAPPTVGAVADGVWDEALAGHLAGGSAGAALNGAGSAGDPWTTTLPGAYGAGTAGKILGDNLNATVGSRATQTSVDDVPTNAELATALGTADDAILAAVAALNNLSAAGIRTAIGLATANLDTQLAAQLAAQATAAAIRAEINTNGNHVKVGTSYTYTNDTTLVDEDVTITAA